MQTLKIKNLKAEINNKLIINGLNLEINSGEIHVIMGPNGAGKSTLAKVIMGDTNYKTNGDIYLDDINISTMSVDEKARMGIFLAMQNPMEIEGVTNADLLKNAAIAKDSKAFNLMKFIKELDNNIISLKMDSKMIHRDINFGFSGGEKKKNEILQMNMLKPSFIILDEIDSGLDVDSLKLVGKNIMGYYKHNKPGILIITHYHMLLKYIKPTHVHIIDNGKIVKSGDKLLVKMIETNGYEIFNK